MQIFISDYFYIGYLLCFYNQLFCQADLERVYGLSRSNYPKQFLAMFQEQTMLQANILRLHGFCSPGVEPALPPIVVLNEKYSFITAEQIHTLGIAKPKLILKGVSDGRNSARHIRRTRTPAFKAFRYTQVGLY
jgi:mannose-1-phosphate guanylyltransferase